MNAPINPAGGGSAGGPPDGPSKPKGPGPAEEPTESFREQLDEASHSEGASPAQGPPTVEATSSVRAIAADLRAGRIEPGQAVDRLIERAVGDAAEAAAMPAVQRAELEAHLRRVLEGDPTLSALVSSLDRER